MKQQTKEINFAQINDSCKTAPLAGNFKKEPCPPVRHRPQPARVPFLPLPQGIKPMTWTWAWHWLRFIALTLGGAATLFIVGLIAIEAVRLRRALREKALPRRITCRQGKPQ